MPISKKRVALLYGGDSAEREISLQSGIAVEAALKTRGYEVCPFDPQNVDLEACDWSEFDVAFIALHGTFGEDGGVQRVLEDAGVPFTGSSSAVSRLVFNKSAAKERLYQFDVPSPTGMLLGEDDPPARLDQALRSIGFPLVVKPNSQGSSLGVSIVADPSDLETALQRAFAFDRFCLLEEWMPGEEWTVALIDNEVLAPIRITSSTTFFDFQAKYESCETCYEVDPPVDRRMKMQITETARRACVALGTRGAARVDLMLDASGEPQVLEVNTIPGLTSHSLLPMAAKHRGMSLEELCDRMISCALQRVSHRAA